MPLLFLAAVSAMLLSGAEATSCGKMNDVSCATWLAFREAFDGPNWEKSSNWKVCTGTSSSGTGCGFCESNKGFLTCEGSTGDLRITSIQFPAANSNVGLSLQNDLSAFAEAVANDPYLQSVTIGNEPALNMDICMPEMCSQIACDFSNSQCYGECSADGSCATPAPTTAAPTDAPTTAAPTTAAPTNAPTTGAPTPPTQSPTEAPTTAAPTFPPTYAPTPAPVCNKKYALRHRRHQCAAWNAFADTFDASQWNACKRFYNRDPCSLHHDGRESCAEYRNLVKCNERGRLIKVRVTREFGMSYDGVRDLTPLQEAFEEVGTLRKFILKKQKNLNLNQCLPRICEVLQCNFEGSTFSNIDKRGNCQA
ncbi:Hypothetical Protein FCC1311_009782 [Hondaea fermentalgiana]|uniref:Uncharacterized protein n=1 Tax=Hondaea fermentalgiana TaxID=2315210 RepID=A0A2R5G177_9STRA|nr:Hypothetical Protein FCC1311_009782 [Hondaea fermentalgiana]|eukprot:GBG24760.1 Hypothetical Protein FCC1311_009782 [Hondaea fermentalgiana]